MYPIIFWLGSIPVPWFGFFASLSFFFSFVTISLRARGLDLDQEAIVDLFLCELICGFVGARLTFALTYPETFRDNPWSVLAIWSGGLTFYGSLIGGMLGVFVYCRRYGYDFLYVCDLWAPATAVSHALGRIGCFGNGCCYGLPTDSGWGFVFPWTDPQKLPRHATQLYEAAGLLVMAAILEVLWRRGYRAGTLTVAYMLLYAPLRIWVETFRGDTGTERFLFGTSLAQTTSMLIAAAALALWFLLPETSPGAASLKAPAEAK